MPDTPATLGDHPALCWICGRRTQPGWQFCTVHLVIACKCPRTRLDAARDFLAVWPDIAAPTRKAMRQAWQAEGIADKARRVTTETPDAH